MTHGGHAPHHGGYYYGGGSRPILPLLFYPMMWYTYRRPFSKAFPGQSPAVQFTARLSFNFRTTNTSSSGWISEQSRVVEVISPTVFLGKLKALLQELGVIQIYYVGADGCDVFRETNKPQSTKLDSLEQAFAALKSLRFQNTYETVVGASISSFRVTLGIRFLLAHSAMQPSLDCFVDATPNVYFVHDGETPEAARQRIAHFAQLMTDFADRSAFVMQERDLLIPALEELARKIASAFSATSSRAVLFEGSNHLPIWRTTFYPRI